MNSAYRSVDALQCTENVGLIAMFTRNPHMTSLVIGGSWRDNVVVREEGDFPRLSAKRIEYILERNLLETRPNC